MKAYDDYNRQFIFLFQYINDKDKDDLYQKYKDINNDSNNCKFKINPYVNDFNNFRKTFENEDNNKNNINNNNFEYIRYINEINGDSFYRSFIFNYIEINLIKQNIKGILMLILDIFKIYDLEPSIFTNKERNINIKNVLICFSIIYDFIRLNLWDKAYKFFISAYNNELDKALIYYIKYNIFIFLSKIFFVLNIETDNKNKKKKHQHHHRHKNYNDYNNNHSNNHKEEFKYEDFCNLEEYSEPRKIIFQSISYIFGISLKIYYFEKEKYNNDFYINKIKFKNPYNEKENEKNKINLFFCYNNYHICYKKSFINSNGKDIINKTLIDIFINNLNKLSPINKNIFILSKYKFCDICNKNCNILEIKKELSNNNNSENILICNQCLYLQIDEHLIQRYQFFYQEKFKNYLYYLNPISLELYSQNEKNNKFNLFLSNSDYIKLYNKTFNERISQIIHTICYNCSKRDNLIKIECDCELCFNCINLFVMQKTKNRIILNIYEKLKIEKKRFECPVCFKQLNINNFIDIFKQNGINLESYYNDAKQRLKILCQKKCLFCLKKINKIEGNKKRIKNYLKFNVKKIIEENNNITEEEKLEEELNYCEDYHILCFNCYKIINKNKIGIKNNGLIYKKIVCNICNYDHFIDMKDWKNLKIENKCCKCIIF